MRNPKGVSPKSLLLRADKLAREGEVSAAADTLEALSKSAKPAERARVLALAARLVRALDPKRANSLIDRAVKAFPNSPAPWIAKAQIADASRERPAAREAALLALEKEPKGTQLIELGLLLARVGEDARGLEAAKSGYAELGRPIQYATALLRVALQVADWATADALTAQMLEGHRAGETVRIAETPRTHLLWCADEQINLAVIRAFAEKNFPAMSPLANQAKEARGRRLRIGYLSSDYRDHATSWLVRGLMRNHDRGRFELFGYCTGWDDGSALRRDMLARFDHVRLFGDLGDKAAAQAVVSDEIDILVDLNGLTEGTRMGILARRPAPVQIAYLGYPGSSGGRFIDFVVADAYVTPPKSGAAYPEKLIRLQKTYQINDYTERRLPPVPPARQAVGLPAEGMVLGMFNNINKVGTQVWETWMQILRTKPGVLLWVLDPGPAARANLLQAMEQAGIDPKRLVFAPKLTQERHIARMQCCDLILDPWPYGGHTSTADAIFAGIPVVAMEGSNFASRVSGSLLHSAGLGQLVNKDREAYIRAAIGLLEKPETIAYAKKFIRETSVKNDIFNARSKTTQLEAAYEDVHARAVRRLPPRDVTLRLVPPTAPATTTAPAAATPPSPVQAQPPPARRQRAAASGTQPELILVCGPWSSGTSAVAGVLAGLGLEGLKPYLRTSDEKTRNSFESLAFRDLVLSLADEDSVASTAKSVASVARLRDFRSAILEGEFGPQLLDANKPIFLKYPLSAALIPAICTVFRTRLVYVLRPLKDIEATRTRRIWPASQGAAGAQRVYAYMFGALVEQRTPTLMVRYPELLEQPVEIAGQLARFAGLDAKRELIEKAAAFVRKTGS